MSPTDPPDQKDMDDEKAIMYATALLCVVTWAFYYFKNKMKVDQPKNHLVIVYTKSAHNFENLSPFHALSFFHSR